MWPFTRMMATRTRPKSLSASRRKRRPELECLEEKQLLSVTFGGDSNGTYAFDSSGPGLRHISSLMPWTMKEGADGTLFFSDSTGTYRYDYGTNHRTLLTSWSANTLSASQDNTLFVSFFNGTGTWEFNGSWHNLTSLAAIKLSAVSNEDVYMTFTGDSTNPNGGAWRYNHGGWNKLSTRTPYVMDATSDGVLFASYSDGTYEYNGGWTKLNSDVDTQITAVSDTEFVATMPTGTGSYDTEEYRLATWWGYPAISWAVSSEAAHELGHSGSTVIMSLDSGTYIYDVDNQSMQQITSTPAILVG
jgi:hypothetical protein